MGIRKSGNSFKNNDENFDMNENISSNSRKDKFLAFKKLHQKGNCFVIPNAWDAGSTKILTELGFPAIATTSAGYAYSMGIRDATASLTRNEILKNAMSIVEATALPVSADLEDGFGSTPQDCFQTIKEAISTGLVGGSIEDATGNADSPIFEFDLAVERVTAAAQAAKNGHFLLTARSENFLYGRNDIDDTISRLQAFEKAGADVLYAPGLPDLESIRLVCASVTKPVNIVMGLSGSLYDLRDLQNAGVTRISVGGSFYRAAMGAFVRAAKEVINQGSFSYSNEALQDKVISKIMKDKKRI